MIKVWDCYVFKDSNGEDQIKSFVGWGPSPTKLKVSAHSEYLTMKRRAEIAEALCAFRQGQLDGLKLRFKNEKI